MTVSAYWWSPRRDARSCMSELRHNSVAWWRMRRRGGRILRNFGDELSANVVAAVTGQDVRWEQAASADVIAIGSVLEIYLRSGGQGHVWGSGLRNPHAPTNRLDRSRFLAVRGTLTRDALGLSDATPLGDPGLLVRLVVPEAPQARQGTLVIPHFSVFNHAPGMEAVAMLAAMGMTVRTPADDHLELCRAIGAAEHVITSSLHGLVVAHALRTPVTLVNIGASQESIFKFDDYMSALGSAATVHDMSTVTGSGIAAVADHARREVDRLEPRINRVVDELTVAASSLGAA